MGSVTKASTLRIVPVGSAPHRPAAQFNRENTASWTSPAGDHNQSHTCDDRNRAQNRRDGNVSALTEGGLERPQLHAVALPGVGKSSDHKRCEAHGDEYKAKDTQWISPKRLMSRE